MRATVTGCIALALAGCTTTNTYNQYTAPEQAAEAGRGGDAAAPDSMRWLFGSGEGAAASIQAWRMLADYVEMQARQGADQSVLMGLPGAEGGLARTSCTAEDGSPKPQAAVFDVDETVLLNLGYEYWQAESGSGYDGGVWAEWERTGSAYTAPVPGAVTGLRRIRDAGVTVIFNTNRVTEYAAATIDALRANGLGEAVHGDTLFLKGDDAMGSAKDGRRAAIAARYCIVALAGDNLGDFADLLNERDRAPLDRRQLTARGQIASLWGNGWFVIPNPVYGASIQGSVDEIFPPEARWTPQATTPKEGE
ncbi:5'-nucleotidase (lipoprotein e(P4) family) [Altererythrobacter atlanticus]|uniref:Lipoprotein E n=1 Tax=Croceibacterium atlanticum TaxID=1267766 RepID=A0A0F7KWT0_9SPHN|nr:HAD family acid phosphatase [Croceibacterium atlanticum]AKH43646.1 Lipoprotein E precursor [Croceibacterium atlanticum]MBB5733870.1 5'-nucleotidase (lipoprotein e(P4) family) [Croceibacterium atlanticum]